jgi:hypothetical protein
MSVNLELQHFCKTVFLCPRHSICATTEVQPVQLHAIKYRTFLKRRIYHR